MDVFLCLLIIGATIFLGGFMFKKYIVDRDFFMVLNRIITPDGTVMVSLDENDKHEYVDALGNVVSTIGGGNVNPYKRGKFVDASVYSYHHFDVVRKAMHILVNEETSEYKTLAELTDKELLDIITMYGRNLCMESKDFHSLFIKEEDYRNE